MEKGKRELHLLDRYIGIPLTILLGLFRSRKRKIDYSSIKKIGILNPASIGDTVLLFGIIKDLAQRFPNAEIIFFSGASNTALVDLNTEIDKNILLKISNPFVAIRQVRAAGVFDIWIDCMPWPRINAILSAQAKAKIKVGFETPKQFRHYVYDVVVKHSDQLHELDNLRNLIKVFDINEFNFPYLDVEDQVKQKCVVIHMFPSGFKSYKKMWPDENWDKVIQYLKHQGYDIYITGGKSDTLLASSFISKFSYNDDRQVINVAGKMGLEDTIKLIKSTQLVISVNTGIMHIAACVKVNLISLNGPTSAKRWGPINENSVSIQSPHKNAPCLNLGFEYSCNSEDCNCMGMITAEDVISEIKLFAPTK